MIQHKHKHSYAYAGVMFSEDIVCISIKCSPISESLLHIYIYAFANHVPY